MGVGLLSGAAELRPWGGASFLSVLPAPTSNREELLCCSILLLGEVGASVLGGASPRASSREGAEPGLVGAARCPRPAHLLQGTSC